MGLHKNDGISVGVTKDMITKPSSVFLSPGLARLFFFVLSISGVLSASAAEIREVRVTPSAAFESEYKDTDPVVTARIDGGFDDAFVSMVSVMEEYPFRSRSFALRDDGLPPDVVAGDKIFSAQLSLADLRLRKVYYGESIAEIDIDVTIVEDGVQRSRELFFMVVDDEARVVPRRINDSTFTTSNVAIIVVPTLEVPFAELAQTVQESTNNNTDSLYLHQNGYRKADATPALLSQVVQNDISGIGLSEFDISSQFGNNESLQLVTLSQGSSTSRINAHLGSRWGVYLNDDRENLTTGVNARWVASDIFSPLSGNPAKRIGNSFQPETRYSRFAADFEDIDLYLMGLIAPEDVRDHFFLTENTGSPSFPIPLADMRRISIDRVREVYGPREPSVDTARKSFSTLFALVSDRLPTAAEIASLDVVSRHFGSEAGRDRVVFGTPSQGYSIYGQPSFASATDFRASMETSLFENCEAGDTVLCLHDGRFSVSVTWMDTRNDRTGIAVNVPRTANSGDFWFFRAENQELKVKILDGRSVNGYYWVFYGALSDIQYTIIVKDHWSGRVVEYVNPDRNLAGGADTELFPRPEPQPVDPEEPCSPDEVTLCLFESRFEVTVEWTDSRNSRAGLGMSIPRTILSGDFWFFSEENPELKVKIIDGRPVNGYFWGFYGSLSDVEYEIKIRDTETGAMTSFFNPDRTLAGGADVAAFGPF